MAAKIFANVSKTDAKLLTISISKPDHTTRLTFGEAELEVTDKAITVYTALTDVPDNLSYKVGESWVDIKEEDLPQRVLISFPFADRDKNELPYAAALLKYVKRNIKGDIAVGKKLYLKGELTLEKSTKLTEYLTQEDFSDEVARVRFFDIKEIEADKFTLLAIDKKAASTNSGSGGGNKGQSQTEIIADRLKYLNSLEDVELRATAAKAYLQLDSLRQDLELKPALTFAEFVKLLLG